MSTNLVIINRLKPDIWKVHASARIDYFRVHLKTHKKIISTSESTRKRIMKLQRTIVWRKTQRNFFVAQSEYWEISLLALLCRSLFHREIQWNICQTKRNDYRYNWPYTSLLVEASKFIDKIKEKYRQFSIIFCLVTGGRFHRVFSVILRGILISFVFAK